MVAFMGLTPIHSRRSGIGSWALPCRRRECSEGWYSRTPRPARSRWCHSWSKRSSTATASRIELGVLERSQSRRHSFEPACGRGRRGTNSFRFLSDIGTKRLRAIPRPAKFRPSPPGVVRILNMPASPGFKESLKVGEQLGVERSDAPGPSRPSLNGCRALYQSIKPIALINGVPSYPAPP